MRRWAWCCGPATQEPTTSTITSRVLDAALSQLPEEITVGHRLGDDPSLVGRPVQVRTDSAGCTSFVFHARARNIGFAVVAPLQCQYSYGDQPGSVRCRSVAAGDPPGRRRTPGRGGG